MGQGKSLVPATEAIGKRLITKPHESWPLWAQIPYCVGHISGDSSWDATECTTVTAKQFVNGERSGRDVKT